MYSNCSINIKSWISYFLAAIVGIWVHEIGHCVPAWLNNIPAFPSPANEYILSPVSVKLNQEISLGGYIGTLAYVIITLMIYIFTKYKYKSEIYAGATAIIGMYCSLIIFNGRGHGGHEFQETQASLGFSYNGHSMDIIVIIVFIALSVIWFLHEKPKSKIFLKIFVGSIIAFLFFIFYEHINNLIFDPLFKGTAIIRN